MRWKIINVLSTSRSLMLSAITSPLIRQLRWMLIMAVSKRVTAVFSMQLQSRIRMWWTVGRGWKTLVEITSTVDYGDHIATNVHRYISDENFPKADYFNMLSRGHWSIENQLHWNLDVNFLEDACRARKGFAPVNLSTIRKLAMQIIKEHIDKSSLKKRRFKASLSNDYLMNMLLNAKFWCGCSVCCSVCCPVFAGFSINWLHSFHNIYIFAN